jgi:hypothetical protein
MLLDGRFDELDQLLNRHRLLGETGAGKKAREKAHLGSSPEKQPPHKSIVASERQKVSAKTVRAPALN